MEMYVTLWFSKDVYDFVWIICVFGPLVWI